MKLIITLLYSALLFQGAQAQGFSIGARTGLGKTLDVTAIRNGAIDNTWDKEVFFRYNTKKRFAFEIGATQYSQDRGGIKHRYGCFVDYEPLYFTAPTHKNLITQVHSNMVDFSLGVQYDISGNAIKEKCPVMKNIGSFIGANVIGTYTKANTRYVDKRISDGLIEETEDTERYVSDIQLGLNHTITYDIKRLYITSVVGYSVSVAMFQRQFADRVVPINSRLTARIGIGYRL